MASNNASFKERLNNATIPGIPALIVFTVMLWFHMHILEAILVASFVYFSIRFVQRLSSKLQLLELISLGAVGSWLVAPILFEWMNLSEAHPYPALHIPSEDYYTIAIPGTILLILGLMIGARSIRNEDDVGLVKRIRMNGQKNMRVGFLLIFFGLISAELFRVLPESLGFLGSLLSSFIFVGTIYIALSGFRFKLLVVMGSLLYTLQFAVAHGMFTLFFWWLLFYLLIAFLIFPVSGWKRMAIVILGMVSLSLIHTVKKEYRFQVRSMEQVSSFRTLSSAFAGKVEMLGSDFFMSSTRSLVIRFNQGMLNSKAMDHVPQNEPFAKGETVTNAIMGAILPRIIWEDKPQAGGRLMMKKYAGMDLPPGISMNIGPLGEGYV